MLESATDFHSVWHADCGASSEHMTNNAEDLFDIVTLSEKKSLLELAGHSKLTSPM